MKSPAVTSKKNSKSTKNEASGLGKGGSVKKLLANKQPENCSEMHSTNRQESEESSEDEGIGVNSSSNLQIEHNFNNMPLGGIDVSAKESEEKSPTFSNELMAVDGESGSKSCVGNRQTLHSEAEIDIVDKTEVETNDNETVSNMEGEEESKEPNANEDQEILESNTLNVLDGTTEGENNAQISTGVVLSSATAILETNQLNGLPEQEQGNSNQLTAEPEDQPLSKQKRRRPRKSNRALKTVNRLKQVPKQEQGSSDKLLDVSDVNQSVEIQKLKQGKTHKLVSGFSKQKQESLKKSVGVSEVFSQLNGITKQEQCSNKLLDVSEIVDELNGIPKQEQRSLDKSVGASEVIDELNGVPKRKRGRPRKSTVLEPVLIAASKIPTHISQNAEDSKPNAAILEAPDYANHSFSKKDEGSKVINTSEKQATSHVLSLPPSVLDPPFGGGHPENSLSPKHISDKNNAGKDAINANAENPKRRSTKLSLSKSPHKFQKLSQIDTNLKIVDTPDIIGRTENNTSNQTLVDKSTGHGKTNKTTSPEVFEETSDIEMADINDSNLVKDVDEAVVFTSDETVETIETKQKRKSLSLKCLKKGSPMKAKSKKQSSEKSEVFDNQELETHMVDKDSTLLPSQNLNSSRDDSSENSTPYKSRYGRVQKKNSSPDMEFPPLVRKRRSKSTSPNEKENSSDQNLEKIDIPESPVLPTKPSTDAANLSSPALLKNPTVTSEKDVPTDYLVGDLLWSRITGYPWWPCMVSFDPILGIYTRVKGTDRKTRSYHVQYFGPNAERSWTFPRNIMPFEGREKFEKWLETMKNKSKTNTKSKGGSKFEMKMPMKKSWEIAVMEAEAALCMTRTERKQNLTFEYIMPANKHDKVKSQSPMKSSKPPVKRRLVSSFSPSEPQSKKLKESLQTPQIITATSTDTPQESHSSDPAVVSKPKGSFFVFSQKHLAQIKIEHPELSDDEIQELLQEMWDHMDEDHRARYIGRFADTDSAPPTKKRAPPKVGDVVECKSRSEKVDMKLEKSSPKRQNFSQQFKPRTTSKREEERSEVMDIISSSDTSSIQDISDMDVPFSSPVPRGEKLCFICEKTGDVISCTGICLQTFHLECLGLTKAPPEFQCDSCTSGKHACFVCKETEEGMAKCSVYTCGKFYHLDCIRRNPMARIEKRSYTCPLHVCQTCFLEDSKQIKHFRGRLLKCVKCPAAYHAGDYCIPAGTLQLTANYILCPRHYVPKKGRQHQIHVSTGWCFICSEGGSLICCESCPASFHAECLQIEPPEGNFYCEDCTNGKFLHYGDIVWVKLGTYRWWPGKICFPEKIPDNILNIPHNVGEFPVFFFGSRDYFWINHGRTFQFQEGDSGSSYSNTNKTTEKTFKKALEEAAVEYEKWKEFQAVKEARKSKKCSRPRPYKPIKVNKPVGKVQPIVPNLSGLCRCDCEPAMENPCGPYTDCINRVLMFECHPDICPAGEQCQNQRFQRLQYVTCECFMTENRGWGLRTLQDIKKDQFVIEYVGELIDEEEYENRLKKMNETQEKNFYFLTVEKDRIIDAGPKGNLARFMNHSCDPNCETQKWMVHGETRVGLFAIRDIPTGSELTFNYNLDCRGNEKTPCTCGSENCSGFIGVRPKPPVSVSQNKRKDIKRKKRKSMTQKHDDDCFCCGEGGELVMCGKKGCPKSYHLKCVGLNKCPYGKWQCPWHHCDECGKQATVMCSLCPGSFCKDHNLPGKITTFSETFNVCGDHDASTYMSLGKNASSDTAELQNSATTQCDTMSEGGNEPSLPADVKSTGNSSETNPKGPETRDET